MVNSKKKTYVAAMPRRALQVEWEVGRSEMKGERIEQRELGWDRHDAHVERMESDGTR